MKFALLSPLCIFALACGGGQDQQMSSGPAPLQRADSPQDESPKDTADTADSSNADSQTLQRLVREQAEMFQLFQLLAGQVESLQSELDELRAAQAAQKDKPYRPSRPSRPRPDPGSVYSVPIVDNPFSGSQRPLVTITESFEFA
jgi:hypothetical protein